MTSVGTQQIQDNYTLGSIGDRIKQALQQAGLGTGLLQWSDLVAFDQFHVRGLEATKELAEALPLKNGQAALDVGSGLGGPARYLAALYGVHVTGIDLTPDFVAVSNYLTQRCGLEEKLRFQVGDATEMPFDNDAFDVAWTQHVAMNIADKAELYRGIHRVLKPAGQLAIYDAVKAGDQPLHYPTPWAREEEISFVATPEEMKEALTGAGFQIRSFTDDSNTVMQWFQKTQQQQREQHAAQKPNPLSPLFILGPEMGPAIANFARNVMEERVRIVHVVAAKL